jgi:hypothetical protein
MRQREEVQEVSRRERISALREIEAPEKNSGAFFIALRWEFTGLALERGRKIRSILCGRKARQGESERMVGVKFSRIAEQKSAELAESLVGKLMVSPRTAAYRSIDADTLREEYRTFFLALTDWLLYRSHADIEEKASRLGRVRASQGVPLEHCVNAMLVCRDHLV